MKRFLTILILSLFTAFSAFAQEDQEDNSPAANKLQERMNLYIQKRLGLSKNEAERFSPVFIRYIIELRRTTRENKADRLILQQKVVDLRIRFRTEFRQILDEQRANKVYDYQREFEVMLRKEIEDRNQQRRNVPRRTQVVVKMDK